MNITTKRCVSAGLILAFFIKIVYACIYRMDWSSLKLINEYSYTEFLINYQGGFTRRGLIGELLYQLYSWHPFPIDVSLTVVSLIIFFTVIAFFFYQFRKQGYCWWILLSPLFLSAAFYIVRKDYLLYLIMIGCFYMLRRGVSRQIYFVCAGLLAIVALLVHEASFFWGIPIYLLFIYDYCKQPLLKWTLILMPIAIFAINCAFVGSPATAHAIVDSWNAIIDGSPMIQTWDNSIGALGWTLSFAISFHLHDNTGNYAFIQIPLYIMAAYYMFSNYFILFDKSNDNARKGNNRLAVSLLYSFSALCLLPMFTILSCDTCRVFQYATIATFAPLVILQAPRVISLFPSWYVKAITSINEHINSFLPPSRGLIVLLILFLAVPDFNFAETSVWINSVVGQLSLLFYICTKCLFHLFV